MNNNPEMEAESMMYSFMSLSCVKSYEDAKDIAQLHVSRILRVLEQVDNVKLTLYFMEVEKEVCKL